VPFSEQKIEVQQQPFFVFVLGVHTRACIFFKERVGLSSHGGSFPGLSHFLLIGGVKSLNQGGY
jgi:hypothetical protein